MPRKARIYVAFICPDCQAPSEVIDHLPIQDDGKPYYNYEFYCQECEAAKHTRYEDVEIRLEEGGS